MGNQLTSFSIEGIIALLGNSKAPLHLVENAVAVNAQRCF